jgi:hypothetical protein
MNQILNDFDFSNWGTYALVTIVCVGLCSRASCFA